VTLLRRLRVALHAWTAPSPAPGPAAPPVPVPLPSVPRHTLRLALLPAEPGRPPGIVLIRDGEGFALDHVEALLVALELDRLLLVASPPAIDPNPAHSATSTH